MRIHVDGEEITATAEHPFYVPQKGWTAAVRLRAGDILVRLNGEYAVVEKVEHELLESPVTVYNFEVEGFHTYYVSHSGLLVHNACGRQRPEEGTRATVNDALDMADDYLGPGYREASPGRFVSADGMRQIRMLELDIGNANPHINFDVLLPKYNTHHIYLIDK